jgi:hypothetical protein
MFLTINNTHLMQLFYNLFKNHKDINSFVIKQLINYIIYFYLSNKFYIFI